MPLRGSRLRGIVLPGRGVERAAWCLLASGLLRLRCRLTRCAVTCRWRAGALTNHFVADPVTLLLQGQAITICLSAGAEQRRKQQCRSHQSVHLQSPDSRAWSADCPGVRNVQAIRPKALRGPWQRALQRKSRKPSTLIAARQPRALPRHLAATQGAHVRLHAESNHGLSFAS